MSEAKHTPGPWNCETTQKNLIEITTEYLVIADVWSEDYDREVDESGWANAHLIAAAPELLEALEGLSWIFERTYDGWILRDALQISIKLNQAEAAIRKAKEEL